MVLECKRNLSADVGHAFIHSQGMVRHERITDYKERFIHRVKMAREAGGFTQVQIAKLLGITQDRYKQYETRSYMPHHMIPTFCLACRVSEAWLLTGEGDGPRYRFSRADSLS